MRSWKRAATCRRRSICSAARRRSCPRTTRGGGSCSASSAWRSTPPETLRKRRGDAERRWPPRRKRPWTLASATEHSSSWPMSRSRRDPEGKDAVLLDVAEKAIPTFEELGDDRGLARAWLLTGWVHGGIHGQEAEREEAAERALVHYRRSGFPAGVCLGQIAAALYYGPAPVGRAVSRCEELLVEEASGPLGRASVDRYLGGLMAMTGAIAQGRELVVHAARQRSTTSDRRERRGICDALLADVELLAGDVPAARQRSRHSARIARRARTVGLLGTAACLARRGALRGRRLRSARSTGVDVARKHAAPR